MPPWSIVAVMVATGAGGVAGAAGAWAKAALKAQNAFGREHLKRLT